MSARKLLVPLTLLCTLFLVAVAIGGCRGHRKRDPEKARKFITWRIDDALDDLEADDAQRKLVMDSKDRLFDRGMTLREQHRALRPQVLAQLESDTPDGEALHKLVDERIEAMRGFAHDALDELLAVHAALRPDQRAEIAERVREHMEDH